MFKTIMMTLKLIRDKTDVTLVITRVRMLHFTRQYKDTLKRIDDFDVVLFQIY